MNKILKIGTSLLELGVNELAFPLEKYEEIISYYLQSKIIILGGDILIRNKNSFKFTYESWYYNPNKNIPHEENLVKSYTQAEEYLKKFPNKNVYFTVIPTIKD